jgi:hypothetical protein
MSENEARRKLNMQSPSEWAAAVSRTRTGATRTNPLYGTDVFNPNAYLPTVPVSSDPSLTQPLPQGRFIDVNRPSPQNAMRQREIQAFLNDPEGYTKYLTQNNPEIVQEQSLMDRGKSILSNLFDYEDDADLSVLGVPLGFVESAWDRTLRHMVGFYDLLNVGFGGLLSAAPGGVDTIPFDQLSGGADVLQILNGEMEPGSAPSPGQIAITSIGLEAKRIREGKARLSDVLLANPATGPFILAALAADTSKVQADGFDLLNKVQRDEAFSSGWEQWMSGVTDAGLAFADPLIGVGVGAKVARAGMLGAKANRKTAIEIGAGLTAAADESLARVGVNKTTDEIFAEIDARMQAQQQMGPQASVVDRLLVGDRSPNQVAYAPVRVTADMRPESFDNTLSELVWSISEYDPATNKKVWDVKRIESLPEIAQLDNKGTIAAVLHEAQDPVMVSTILQAMSGTPGAMERLAKLRPAIADTVMRVKHERYVLLRGMEPTKRMEARDGLQRDAQNAREQIDALLEQQQRLQPEMDVMKLPDAEKATFLRLQDRINTLEQNVAEVNFLTEVIDGGRMIDPLDAANNPFYREEAADQILNDLLNQDNLLGRLVGDAIDEASGDIGIKGVLYGKDKTLLYKDNMLSDLTRRSRARRAQARYEYGMEGTRVIPRRVQTGMHIAADGTRKPVYKWEGLWTASQFEGTSRLQRNIRVWRWLGEETPSGYIGLKGAGTVGSENEFTAATNIDLYKSDPVTVTRDVVDADGRITTETIEVGGIARRQSLYEEFFAALNDPTKDSMEALRNVEAAMASDLSLAYGIEADKLIPYVKSAGKIRDREMQQMRARAFFVDPDTGDIDIVPYLKSHLMNGTYMLNFQNMEKTLRKLTAKDGGKRLQTMLGVGGHYSAQADRLFQNVWRPLALMRASYTQRNVFEGLGRAMAYTASLAPLTWPIRATTNGTRNAIIKRTLERKVTAAQRAIGERDLTDVYEPYKQVSLEHLTLQGAIELTDADGATRFAVVRRGEDGQRTWDYLTAEAYEAEFADVTDRMNAARAVLRQEADQLTASIKDTAFGKWRERELKDLNKGLEDAQRKIDIWAELITEPNYEGRVYQLGEVPEAMRDIINVMEQAEVLRRNLDILEFRPMESMALYREFAGRQKRIGSGTSMGSDGNYYGDAFTTPYEQLNRKMLSSDNTVKQSLSVDSTAYHNFFQRLLVRTNQPVDFIENPEQWNLGMADAIEDASSNEIVRILVGNDWDVDATVAWLMSDTGSARRFGNGVAQLFDDNGVPSLLPEDARLSAWEEYVGGMPEAKVKRLRTFFKEEQAGSGTFRKFDREQAQKYVEDVSDMLQRQFRMRPEFYEMLRRRAIDKSEPALGVRPKGYVPSRITGDDVAAVTSRLSDSEREALGYIQGSEIIQSGMDNVVGLWEKFTGTMFKMLGTIPEDAVVRGPFYNTRFKAARNALIEEYWISQGMNMKDVRRANRSFYKNQTRTKAGAVNEYTLSHAPFQIPARELSRIESLASRRALQDTREYMYTIERRTNLGKYGEWLFPFISASQNSVTVAGKLLYREPWLAPMIADLWRMPQRMGWEDEEGNIWIPSPFPGFTEWLSDKPGVPFLGGAIDSSDLIGFNKDAFNVWVPDTGFGVLPRPVAWSQALASEMMKRGAFPIETPEMFKTAFGEGAGDQAYQLVKDYIFGTEGSMSEKFASYDLLTPPIIQRLIQMTDDMDAAYGYQYALQGATQMMRWKAGERDDMPQADEIGARTTNMFWFQWLGNVGIPTPMMPTPILSRPQVRKAAEEMMDVYQQMKQADPENASLNMYNMFGEWGLEAANTKITVNTGGADPTAQAASDIKTFDSLIGKITDAVPEENYNLLGIILNNRSVEAEYNQYAYDFQKATTIAGTGKKFREVQSPQESQAERERIVGWTMYRKGMDFLDAQLASRGLKSYESAGARDLKAARQRMVMNMAQNPELQGWFIDFQDFGGSRTNGAVRVLELATTDEKFVQEMTAAGKTQLLANMDTYVRARRYVIQKLTSSGTSINDPENYMLKETWSRIRQGLKNSDERWAAIADRYLAADDEPTYPGNFMSTDMGLMEEVG